MKSSLLSGVTPSRVSGRRSISVSKVERILSKRDRREGLRISSWVSVCFFAISVSGLSTSAKIQFLTGYYKLLPDITQSLRLGFQILRKGVERAGLKSPTEGGLEGFSGQLKEPVSRGSVRASWGPDLHSPRESPQGGESLLCYPPGSEGRCTRYTTPGGGQNKNSVEGFSTEFPGAVSACAVSVGVLYSLGRGITYSTKIRIFLLIAIANICYFRSRGRDHKRRSPRRESPPFEIANKKEKERGFSLKNPPLCNKVQEYKSKEKINSLILC